MGQAAGRCDAFACRTGEFVLSLLALVGEVGPDGIPEREIDTTRRGGDEIARGSWGLGEVGGLDGGCLAVATAVQLDGRC